MEQETVRKQVREWIDGAKAILNEFPELRPEDAVSFATYERLENAREELSNKAKFTNETFGLMGNDLRKELTPVFVALNERWADYSRAEKEASGGRKRRKTRKGKKRTTRRKKTSRR